MFWSADPLCRKMLGCLCLQSCLVVCVCNIMYDAWLFVFAISCLRKHDMHHAAASRLHTNKCRTRISLLHPALEAWGGGFARRHTHKIHVGHASKHSRTSPTHLAHAHNTAVQRTEGVHVQCYSFFRRSPGHPTGKPPANPTCSYRMCSHVAPCQPYILI
jgi:hypothetical protein